MPIWSMALFGSRARGDDEPNSDIDLLFITDEAKPRLINSNRMSCSFYPSSHLFSKAEEGDLFVLHLVREAKIFYDEKGDFDDMSKAFRFKESYAPTIEQASSLGSFILEHREAFDDASLANKRIAWCVRTILIARAADVGRAIFAARALAEFAGEAIVEELIQNKAAPLLSPAMLLNFRKFLNRWGQSDIAEASSIKAYLQHFRRTGNAVGLRTYFASRDSFSGLYE
ncbi:nucleotidyltransferase family protein [Bradyrhizobium sp. RDT46]|uniref:anti-phage Hailong system nucleotidyltransferase HalB n=1 Tax=Bradyrhizobium sp. RDT46 TaxID=3341829 RepID=UPI0035C6DA2E